MARRKVSNAAEVSEGGEEERLKKLRVLFTVERWKGVQDVFKCARCGTFRDTRDAMIEHVLLHYPAREQEALLEKILKGEC